MKLVVEAPINSLSFGNVSVNLLREMYKKQMDIALFPTGGQADLEAFDKIDKNFVDWLQKSTDNRFNKIKQSSAVNMRERALNFFIVKTRLVSLLVLTLTFTKQIKNT